MINLATRTFRGINPRQHHHFGWKKRFLEKAIKQRQQQIKQLKAHQQAQPTKYPEEDKVDDESLSEQDRKIINTYKVDKMWNLLVKEDPNHNFQKEIILHRKAFEKTTKQLRSAILFEDLLKTEIDITIYNTKGKPYAWAMLKFIYLFLTVGASLWSIAALRKVDPKNSVLLDRTTQGKIFKYTVYCLCIYLFFSTLLKYHSFQRKYVETIVYNTQRQEFTFTKRSFFGFKYPYVVSRFKILYTQNKFLNEKGTNYFDIDTKQQFSIAYKDSWIKQDLFSHLISQRIKL